MPIPTHERLVAKLLLARHCRKIPLTDTAAIIREQEAALRNIFEAHPNHLTLPVQIKRIPGLEAVSTNYSLAMVADHLARVNHAIAALLTELAANRASNMSADPADYKPPTDAQPEPSLQSLVDAHVAIERALANTDPIEQSTLNHTHPWFGPLPARNWACFPTFHNQIHLKQAHLIAKGL